MKCRHLHFQDLPKARGAVKSALLSQLETVDDVVGQEVPVVALGELEFFRLLSWNLLIPLFKFVGWPYMSSCPSFKA